MDLPSLDYSEMEGASMCCDKVSVVLVCVHLMPILPNKGIVQNSDHVTCQL